VNKKFIHLFQKLIFQKDYYLAHNLDILLSGVEPYRHWKKYGKYEIRFFSSKIDFSGKVKSINIGELKSLIPKETYNILTDFFIVFNKFYIDSWHPGRNNWGVSTVINDFDIEVNRNSIIYPHFLKIGNKGGVMIQMSSELIINVFKVTNKRYIVYFNLGMGPTNSLIRKLMTHNMYLVN
jgi:hypothetical protein